MRGYITITENMSTETLEEIVLIVTPYEIETRAFNLESMLDDYNSTEDGSKKESIRYAMQFEASLLNSYERAKNDAKVILKKRGVFL